MLSYKDYKKTKATVELTLDQWDFLAHMLRIRAKELGEQLEYKKAIPFLDIADKIDNVTEKIIYGGNN